MYLSDIYVLLKNFADVIVSVVLQNQLCYSNIPRPAIKSSQKKKKDYTAELSCYKFI